MIARKGDRVRTRGWRGIRGNSAKKNKSKTTRISLSALAPLVRADSRSNELQSLASSLGRLRPSEDQSDVTLGRLGRPGDFVALLVTAALGVLPSRHWHIHVLQVTGQSHGSESHQLCVLRGL